MSAEKLISLRAGEIVDEFRMAVLGVTPQRVERAVLRVLRSRGQRFGAGVDYPPVAVLYLSPFHYRRLAALLEAERPAIEQRIAERLDQDRPMPLRLHVRRDPRVRRLQVAVPAVRYVVPVRRSGRHPDWTALEPTRPDPTRHTPHSSGLALRPLDDDDPVIPVPEAGLTLGRDVPGRVRDHRASREHTELARVGPGRLRCRDLGSRNGTWVDGTRITGPVDLRLGQRLRIGGTVFQVVWHDITDDGGDA